MSSLPNSSRIGCRCVPVSQSSSRHSGENIQSVYAIDVTSANTNMVLHHLDLLFKLISIKNWHKGFFFSFFCKCLTQFLSATWTFPTIQLFHLHPLAPHSPFNIEMSSDRFSCSFQSFRFSYGKRGTSQRVTHKPLKELGLSLRGGFPLSGLFDLWSLQRRKAVSATLLLTRKPTFVFLMDSSHSPFTCRSCKYTDIDIG